jgi:hypothetical protein
LNKQKPKSRVGKLREGEEFNSRPIGFSLPGLDMKNMTKSTKALLLVIAVSFLLFVFTKLAKAFNGEEDSTSKRRQEIKAKRKNQ